jgi:haloalkane dehalogenase
MLSRTLPLLITLAALSACTVRYGPKLASGTPAEAVPWLDRVAYPFSSRFLDVDGGKLHYLDEGPRDGPTVVLVHGTPTWSFLYRDVIRELSGDVRCIALDHIGFGLSDKPLEGFAYTPAAHAANLVALLDHLDVRDATIVLHDLGGPIAFSAALERPERIARVAVLNSFAWSVAENEDAQQIDSLLGSGLGQWLYEQRNISPEMLLPSVFSEGNEPSDEVKKHYTHPFADETQRRGLLRIGQELIGSSDWYAGLWTRREELREKLGLLVFGLEDPTFGPETLAVWREAFPRARVVELAGIGHFPQEEAPLEVARALKDFAMAGGGDERHPAVAREGERELRPEAPARRAAVQ